MIRYAKLDLMVDIVRLQREVSSLGEEWKPHFNTMHYEGGWTVLPLRAPGGRSGGIVPDLMGDEQYMDTPLMQSFPSVQQLLGSIHCPVLSVRFLNLQSGAIIKPHRDHDLSFENGEARLHFPVFTNDKVEFYVDDELLHMHEGSCWYINANLMHRVTNGGDTDRIHLVVDCEVNDWLKDVFTRAEKSDKPDEDNREQLLKVIEELKRQNTEASQQLVRELEKSM
jgi:hypothetical protein